MITAEMIGPGVLFRSQWSYGLNSSAVSMFPLTCQRLQASIVEKMLSRTAMKILERKMAWITKNCETTERLERAVVYSSSLVAVLAGRQRSLLAGVAPRHPDFL